MRFFARFTLIVNICFLASVVMRLIEIGNKAKDVANGSVKLNPFISSIVVLGWIAIFINLFFAILFIARYTSKKMNDIPKWIVYFNLILLPMQVYYYFFSTF